MTEAMTSAPVRTGTVPAVIFWSRYKAEVFEVLQRLCPFSFLASSASKVVGKIQLQ